MRVGSNRGGTMQVEPYTFKMGAQNPVRLRVKPHKMKVTVRLEESNVLLYSFRRAEDNGPLLKPENVGVSGKLHDTLEKAFGFVSKEVRVGGELLTCQCDSPMLSYVRHWSDGPSRHHWYSCKNCDTRGAIHSNHKNELTSTGPFILAGNGE